MDVGIYLLESQSLKDQGKSRTVSRRQDDPESSRSQSLKDQGKSRTLKAETLRRLQSRNPLKIRASLGRTAPLRTC